MPFVTFLGPFCRNYTLLDSSIIEIGATVRDKKWIVEHFLAVAHVKHVWFQGSPQKFSIDYNYPILIY